MKLSSRFLQRRITRGRFFLDARDFSDTFPIGAIIAERLLRKKLKLLYFTKKLHIFKIFEIHDTINNFEMNLKKSNFFNEEINLLVLIIKFIKSIYL